MQAVRLQTRPMPTVNFSKGRLQRVADLHQGRTRSSKKFRMRFLQNAECVSERSGLAKWSVRWTCPMFSEKSTHVVHEPVEGQSSCDG